jgi:hypothetical protein
MSKTAYLHQQWRPAHQNNLFCIKHCLIACEMIRTHTLFNELALKSVDRFFNGALPVQTHVNMVVDILKQHSFKFNHVLCASYLDPLTTEEENNPEGHISLSVAKKFGSPCLPLGGLGGLPFMGEEGWQKVK